MMNWGEAVRKIVIAGTSSGVGKTTISLGLMKALKNRGLKVQPFKVGPDYIDPSYHTFITGRYSRNLDSYMLDDEKIKYIVSESSIDADISIIEGVMGLYDGFGTDIDNCTTSYTSKILKSPVILVINGKAMGASSAATVLGYQQLDKNVNIKGIIINNIKTESHFSIVKESIEKYCGVEVLGYLPPNKQLSLESRHLGLIPSMEIGSLEQKLNILASEIEKYVDLDRILEISESEYVSSEYNLDQMIESKNLREYANGKTIAVAFDKAFNFYYRENIDLLYRIGLNVEFFSPLNDKEVPKSDYIYIGGGFPEIYARELYINENMRNSILNSHKNGTPIYAECGGLMYLGSNLKDLDDVSYDMVGIFEGTSKMTSSLKRFGYCYGIAKIDTVLSNKGEVIKGHEFHHSTFESSEDCAYTMVKERDSKKLSEWDGGYSKKNTLATYLHTHFYDNIDCLKNFLIRGNE